MNLIDRYVHEVGKRLPKKQRIDVEAELHSLLSDMVEDRAQTKVNEADEEVVVDVLRDFGSPSQVAGSYQPRKNYLIGPELFPIFKLVVTVVITVLGALALVGIFISAVGSENFLPTFLKQLTSGFLNYLQNMIGVFANIVIVFALIEWFVPADKLAREMADEEGVWDPRSLPVPDDDKDISRLGTIIGIVFGVIFLAWLNVYPNQAGVFYFNEEPASFISILSPNFFNILLPWVNISIIVSIGVDIFKLWRGKRTLMVRMLEIGKEVVSAVVLYIFISNPPVFSISAELAGRGGFEELADLLNSMARIGFPILLILTLVTVVKKMVEFVRAGGGKTAVNVSVGNSDSRNCTPKHSNTLKI